MVAGADGLFAVGAQVEAQVLSTMGGVHEVKWEDGTTTSDVMPADVRPDVTAPCDGHCVLALRLCSPDAPRRWAWNTVVFFTATGVCCMAAHYTHPNRAVDAHRPTRSNQNHDCA
eukprot:gene25215-65768_t